MIKKIIITLLEPMLGTKPADMKVFEHFVASKAPDGDDRKEELETMERVEESGSTVFFRTEKGELFIKDYQFMGFLKAAGTVLRECNPSELHKGSKKKMWSAIKSKVDKHVVIRPKVIILKRDSKPVTEAGGTLERPQRDTKAVTEAAGTIERPLRVDTAQGPRTCLARSEFVDSGVQMEIEIDIMPGAPITEDMLERMLDYGQRVGLGQWRNAGNGRFSYEVLETVKDKKSEKKDAEQAA
jgi:hypothetical protein